LNNTLKSMELGFALLKTFFFGLVIELG